MTNTTRSLDEPAPVDGIAELRELVEHRLDDQATPVTVWLDDQARATWEQAAKQTVTQATQAIDQATTPARRIGTAKKAAVKVAEEAALPESGWLRVWLRRSRSPWIRKLRLDLGAKSALSGVPDGRVAEFIDELVREAIVRIEAPGGLDATELVDVLLDNLTEPERAQIDDLAYAISLTGDRDVPFTRMS